jgi:hypothetical protein
LCGHDGDGWDDQTGIINYHCFQGLEKRQSALLHEQVFGCAESCSVALQNMPGIGLLGFLIFLAEISRFAAKFHIMKSCIAI